MINKQILGILDRINKEHPCYGSIHITMVFHEERFVRYDYCINEIHIIEENKKNGEK